MKASCKDGYSSYEQSRATSGRVSPSDLPDSPGGTPPAQRRARAAALFHAARKPLSIPTAATTAAVNKTAAVPSSSKHTAPSTANHEGAY